jgi:hypothetical protein
MKGKAASPTKDTKSGKPSQNGKEGLRQAHKHKKLIKLKKLPLTISVQVLPLDRYYHVSSLSHPVRKEFNQLCAHTLPFGNELIKHKPREERDAMHEIQN